MTNHEPGRELDALIAEKVMGLPVVWRSDDPYREIGMPAREGRRPFLKGYAHGCHYDWADVPLYSTDIAAAFQVVEHIKAQSGFVLIEYIEAGGDLFWAVVFGVENAMAYADTLPHAICLAALAAIEGQEH